MGQRDEKSIRQACGRANQVYLYTYGGRGADQWWKDNGASLERLSNLTVMNVPVDGTRALATLAQRTMELHCTIQDGQIVIGDGKDAVQLELATLKAASAPFGR